MIRAAVAAVEPTDYLPLRAYVAMSLAELERLANRPDGEQAALEEALRLVEQKGDVVTTDRLRERLGELSPAT